VVSGYADPDGTELGVSTEQQWLAHFEVPAFAGKERHQQRHRRPRQQRVQFSEDADRLPLESRVAVRDSDAMHVYDRGKRDVVRIEARLQDRSEAGIAPQRLVRIHTLLDDVPGPVRNRLHQKVGAGPALVQAHPGQPSQVHHAQRHDDDADDRRDAEDLFALDP
jgi:hypothetical protein